MTPVDTARSVSAVTARPHLAGGRIDLAWQNPPGSAFDPGQPFAGIRILRRERTFPLAADDGVVVYDGPVVESFADRGLAPLNTYYYTIFTAAGGGSHFADDAARAAAFATADYGLAGQLYRMLPATHLRHDVLSTRELAQLDPVTLAALAALPPTLRGAGPLRRFFASTASLFDLMRSTAEGLTHLHDTDRARPEFLPLLAGWVGWDLDRSRPVDMQRAEIKAAPHLYRSVGTVPSLRTFVSRYTGWHTQVVEFGQNIARANAAPQLNIFALAQAGSAWLATDDAAPILGFGPGNDEANGGPGTSAALTGTTAEPFALRPGMELTLALDDHLPVTVRFQAGDFADIAAATAAEVATVVNRELTEVSASSEAGGRLRLRAQSIGPRSHLSLEAEPHPASLVTLEGAPRGRLSALVDGQGRLRLFYAALDPQSDLPARLRVKTFRQGWGDAADVPPAAAVAQAEPAAVILGSGNLWLAYIEGPAGAARLRCREGTPRSPQPARLITRRGAPFALTPGSTLVLRAAGQQPQQFVFLASDFATPGSGTALEVANALNARLQGVIADVVGNAVRLNTTQVGPAATLSLDLRYSTAARGLGFDAGNAAAVGDAGDAVDWQPPADVPTAPTGTPASPIYHADLHALVDGGGQVWLFWALADATGWHIVSTRLNAGAWSPLETLAAGPFGDREPYAALDNTGRIWLFWARRKVEHGTPDREIGDDNWTLWRRVFDGAWGAQAELLASPPGRAADHEPAALLRPGGNLELFFRSDRAGGADLWSVTVNTATQTAGTPVQVTDGPAGDHAPVPVQVPDPAGPGARPWLLFRSDRSVSLSRATVHPLAPPDNRINAPVTAPVAQVAAPRSTAVADNGTFRRHAGTVTVTLNDAGRNGRARQVDDLLAYTPQGVHAVNPFCTEQDLSTPGTIGREGDKGPRCLGEQDFYTPGTVGLYLTQVVTESALSRQMVERLLAVLKRFVPVNVRVLVILVPRFTEEIVYGVQPDGSLRDIGEQYQDLFPFVEQFGAAQDQTTATTNTVLFLSADMNPATPDLRSADPAQPATFRNRSFTNGEG